jgi:hypothetical protein
MGMACCSDAAFCVTDYGTNAATVGLQVNEFRFDAPTCVGLFGAEVEEALVYFDVILAFDVGGFELVHGLVV